MRGTKIPCWSIDSYQSCRCTLLVGTGIPQRISQLKYTFPEQISAPPPQIDHQNIISGCFGLC